jgi:hypothetical protein
MVLQGIGYGVAWEKQKNSVKVRVGAAAKTRVEPGYEA